jgi:hypothetical protein
MTKLIVVHDSNGQVLALGEVHSSPRKGIGSGVVPREGQSMFEVDKKGPLAKKSLRDIHKEFRVDVAAKKLIKAV